MSTDYWGQLPPEAKQSLTFSEVEGLIGLFKAADRSGKGKIPKAEVPAFSKSIVAKFGDSASIFDAFLTLGVQELGFPELAKLFVQVRTKKFTKVSGKGSDTVHSFSEDEKKGYVDYINSTLDDDPQLKEVIPVDPHTMDIFPAISQGVLLCKLINKGFPGTIEEHSLAVKNPNTYQRNENHDKCIAGAKKIGCQVINIGANDLSDGTAHLVLGLVWQIIKKNLLAQVAANVGADNADNLPPEQILFRWFNSHLARGGSSRVVSNWSSDLADGENYVVLLSQLDPALVSSEDRARALAETDPIARAELILEFADRLGCRQFLSASELVSGNPRLNLAFVATLFNKFPNMGPNPLDLARAKTKELESKLDKANSDLNLASGERDGLNERLAKSKAEVEQKSKELDEVSKKLGTALEQRDRISREKAALENELAEANQSRSQMAKEIESLKNEREDLSKLLRQEKEQRERLAKETERLQQELAASQREAAEERKAKEAALNEIDQLKKRIEELLKEREQLLAKIKALEEKNADLDRKLKEEISAKDALTEELRETNELLEETRIESDEEKTLLLQRIKDLDEEVSSLNKVMANSLDAAAKEKADALLRARQDKDTALSAAEQARLMQMRKVQGLLSKVQRQGWLFKQKKGKLGGTSWKKRYFVLQDHILSYYRDHKAFMKTEPLGIIYCEQCRVYELDNKRPFAFQLDTGAGAQHNLAATKLEEMKNWMKDIKEAKKKAVGVKVVSEEKAT